MEAGYFDISSSLKPLLHTWSLSVEEQFYFIAPIGTFIILKTLNKKFFFSFFLILFFICLLISIIYHEVRNTGIGSSDFYLMPFRAYEFLLGILAVFFIKFWPNKKFLNEIIFLLGLLLIFFSALFFDEKTHLPSYNALYPCLGAFFIILSGDRITVFSHVLKNKIILRVGLISYSLYLIHWPLIVFYKYLWVKNLEIFDQLIIILVSIIISHYMYEKIEKVFRYNNNYLTKFKINKGNVIFSLIFFIPIMIIFHCWHYNGWYWRLSNENRKLLKSSLNTDFKENKICRYSKFKGNLSELEFNNKLKFCSKKYGPATLILGDSHATDLYNALSINSKNKHLIDMSKGGKNLISDLNSKTNHFKKIKKFVSQNKQKIQHIIYTQRGKHFFNSENNFYDKKKIDYVINYLKSIEKLKVKIIWVGHLLEPGFDVSKFNFLIDNLYEKVKFKIDNKLVELDNYLISYSAENNIKYLSKIKMININFKKDFIIDGYLTFSNEDHWSVKGEEYFGKRIIQNKHIKNYFSTID